MRWIWAIVFVLAGCGGSGDSGGGKPKDREARTPEEALSWLGGGDKSRFEAWRDGLVKNCDARAIFGEARANAGGIDLRLLDKRLGGSWLAKGENGEFAFLGAPDGLLGTSHGQYHAEKSADGKVTEEIRAESELSGTKCKVTLYGQTIFDGHVAQRVSVLGHYNPKKRRPKIRIAEGAEEAPRGGKLAVSTTAVVLPVTEALMGNDATVPFVEHALGLREGEGKVLLKIGAPYDDGTILPTSWRGTAFSPRHPEIMGDEGEIARFRAGPRHEETMKWLLRPIAKGTPPASAWTFSARVALDGSAAKGGNAQLVSLTLEAPTNYDDAAAATCFVNRFNLARAFYGDPSSSAIKPSYDKIAGPCAALTADEMVAWLGDNQARRSFLSVFNGVVPAKATVYGDWREALIDLAWVASTRGDIATVLDPEVAFPLVRQGAADAQYFLDGTRDLPALRTDLLVLAFNWALGGIAGSERAGVLEAAKRAGPAFPDSTKALLVTLTQDPKADAEALRFARELAPSYVDAWNDAEAKATAPGAAKWIRERRAETLQKRFAPGQLKAWNATNAAAKLFADQDLARVKGTFHSTHDHATESLVGTALAEGWDTTQFTDLSTVASMAKMKIACTNAESAAELANCVGLDKFSRKPGHLLDPAFDGRYGRFAPIATALHVGYESSTSSLKWEFENALFSPIWARCDNAAFSSHVETLRSKSGALAELKDFSARWKLETEIRELLKDCP